MIGLEINQKSSPGVMSAKEEKLNKHDHEEEENGPLLKGPTVRNTMRNTGSQQWAFELNLALENELLGVGR